MNRLYKLNEGEYNFILTETLRKLFQESSRLYVIDLIHSKQSNKEIIYKMKDSDLFDDITIFMSQLIH